MNESLNEALVPRLIELNIDLRHAELVQDWAQHRGEVLIVIDTNESICRVPTVADAWQLLPTLMMP